ncbi:unnamed protein product [Rotaria sp. Silwood2]|nr:unnamed protein product [Rotaria sp. Silwood2]
MMVGCSFLILLFEVSIFIGISHQLFAELVEKLLDINRIDNQTFIMNFYGFQVNLLLSRRFRLSLSIQLGISTCIISLLILDGLLMNVQKLNDHDLCPTIDHDCFVIRKISLSQRIVCQSGLSISNLTSFNTICFVWIYKKQTAVEIINQIGICSSVFSLLCHCFKYACHISRRWWGFILLIILIIISKIILILSFIVENPISMTAKTLLIAFTFLLINVIQLLHFTHNHHYRTNKCDCPTNV